MTQNPVNGSRKCTRAGRVGAGLTVGVGGGGGRLDRHHSTSLACPQQSRWFPKVTVMYHGFLSR